MVLPLTGPHRMIVQIQSNPDPKSGSGLLASPVFGKQNLHEHNPRAIDQIMDSKEGSCGQSCFINWITANLFPCLARSHIA